MLISEKQIMQLMETLEKIMLDQYQTPEIRMEIYNIIKEIINQQSEELKVIE